MIIPLNADNAEQLPLFESAIENVKEIKIENHIRKIMILKFASLLGSDRLLSGDLTESGSVKFQQGGETYYLSIDLKINNQKEYEKYNLD